MIFLCQPQVQLGFHTPILVEAVGLYFLTTLGVVELKHDSLTASTLELVHMTPIVITLTMLELGALVSREKWSKSVSV